MGNPHVVVPVDDLSRIPFEEWGAALEVHPVFPAKTNVHFLKVHSRDRLEIRVWERGAGPTLACGTGACATLVAAVLLDLADEQAEVMLPGGPLLDFLAWSYRGSVLMTGPAEAVFDGVITPELVPAPFSPSESMAQVPDANTRTTPDDTIAAPSPEDEAAALAKVQAFLNDTSLDSMLNLASDSFRAAHTLPL